MPHPFRFADHPPRRAIASLVAALLALPLLAGCGGQDEAVPTALPLYRSLGSLQCQGGGRTLADLQQELIAAGLSAPAGYCASDGRPRVALCGTDDGRIGVFELPAWAESRARSLGFAPLGELPDARAQPCPAQPPGKG